MGKTLALLSNGTQQQQQQQQLLPQQEHSGGSGVGWLSESVLRVVQLKDVESVGAAQGFFGRLLAQVRMWEMRVTVHLAVCYIAQDVETVVKM